MALATGISHAVLSAKYRWLAPFRSLILGELRFFVQSPFDPFSQSVLEISEEGRCCSTQQEGVDAGDDQRVATVHHGFDRSGGDAEIAKRHLGSLARPGDMVDGLDDRRVVELAGVAEAGAQVVWTQEDGIDTRDLHDGFDILGG